MAVHWFTSRPRDPSRWNSESSGNAAELSARELSSPSTNGFFVGNRGMAKCGISSVRVPDLSPRRKCQACSLVPGVGSIALSESIPLKIRYVPPGISANAAFRRYEYGIGIDPNCAEWYDLIHLIHARPDTGDCHVPLRCWFGRRVPNNLCLR